MANNPQNKNVAKIVIAVLSFFVLGSLLELVNGKEFSISGLIDLLFQVFFVIFFLFSIFRSKNKTADVFKRIGQSLVQVGNPAEPILKDFTSTAQTALSPSPILLEAEEIDDLLGEGKLTHPQAQPAGSISEQVQSVFSAFSQTGKRLSKKQKYLQVALNSTLDDAGNIMAQLPRSEKIIIEAGTPLIKTYGTEAIRTIRWSMPGAYIVADTKIADLAAREVEIFKKAGANAITALGVAPIETLDEFIAACRANNLDAMLDMMNVPSAIAVLKKLKVLPEVVILHRGVDETEKSHGKMIPYYQINQVKGNYNLMVAIAGGDTPNEIQSAVFNGADIVVVWKDFMTGGGVGDIAQNFLKEIK